MFEVTFRDGAARTGILTVGSRSIPTPGLLLINHSRFRTPHGPLVSETFLIGSEPGPVTLEGRELDGISDVYRGGPMVGDPGSMAASLVSHRSEAGYAKALYLPGTGTIPQYALLTYAGADLLDASRLIISSRNSEYLTADGAIHASAWKPGTCHCPACMGDTGTEHADDHGATSPARGDRVADFHRILAHNLLAALREMCLIRHAISNGTLRNLVERRVRADPALVSIFRHLDRQHAPFFRERVAFTGGRVIGVSDDTLLDPRVTAYHSRMEGYRKPGGDILLLLPCSARKPYSTSRSHRRFATVTSGFPGIIHEMIVTSPLGLVPRELENFCPAADYDISVTGEWSHTERELIGKMLMELLGTNEYTHIINHTPYGFVMELLEGDGGKGVPVMHTALEGSTTSDVSLQNLGRVLERCVKDARYLSSGAWKRNCFASMWRYQFVSGADLLPDDTRVTGRFPFLKAAGPSGQFAMMVPGARRISLTLAGGELLLRGRMNRVFIEDFFPSGDVFAVGIRDADPGIRVGDEVVVVRGNPGEEGDTGPEIRGVGVAEMGTRELVESTRGVGVRLRHRAKRK